MIYQGSNGPIVLTFENDMSDVFDFSAILRKDDTIQKRWKLADVSIDKKVVLLPLTQEETMNFDTGSMEIECKYAIKDKIYVTEIAKTGVRYRADKEVLNLED